MKKYVSVTVSITDFGPECHKWCRVYEKLPGEQMTERTISYDKARRMMWELKLAGAYKTTAVNPYDPHINTTDVRLYLPV